MIINIFEKSTALWQFVYKLLKMLLDVSQIFEKIHVIFGYIAQDYHLRIDLQHMSLPFTSLDYQPLAFSKTKIAPPLWH